MTARGDRSAETWMLFCSGGATRIDVDLHEPGELRHATKVAHVVKDCDAAMRDAAERGCRAALAWVERRTGAAPACVVSFDLPDVPAGRDVGDASGGLAFAVAAARAMHAAAPGAIAAVGEIESGLRGGPLRGVEGIEAKIGGALDRLPESGRLVYPTGNDSGIPARLRERLDERDIETTPVASVDEALDRLFAVVEAEADSPAVADAPDPQRESVPAPSGAGAEGSVAKPPIGAPRPATGSRVATRWLIPVGVAAAAAVALWLGYEGQHMPVPSAEQTAVESETAEPSPSPDGPRPAGTESGTPTATAAVPAQDGTSPESKAAEPSFNEASRSDASDAPTDSSFEEASNDHGFD